MVLCLSEALVWLKYSEENSKNLSIKKHFLYLWSENKAKRFSSIKQKKEEAQGEKERIIVLTWAIKRNE